MKVIKATQEQIIDDLKLQLRSAIDRIGVLEQRMRRFEDVMTEWAEDVPQTEGSLDTLKVVTDGLESKVEAIWDARLETARVLDGRIKKVESDIALMSHKIASTSGPDYSAHRVDERLRKLESFAGSQLLDAPNGAWLSGMDERLRKLEATIAPIA